MAESLSCPPETITILLIGYTPIQNIKLKKNNNQKEHIEECFPWVKWAEFAMIIAVCWFESVSL